MNSFAQSTVELFLSVCFYGVLVDNIYSQIGIGVNLLFAFSSIISNKTKQCFRSFDTRSTSDGQIIKCIK